MRQLAIDLRQRLFAAHCQHRVAEGDEDADQADELRRAVHDMCAPIILLNEPVPVPQPPQALFRVEAQIVRRRQGRHLAAALDQRQQAPQDQDHDHNGRDVHDAHGVFG